VLVNQRNPSAETKAPVGLFCRCTATRPSRSGR